MKRKLINSVLTACLVVPCLFGLSACADVQDPYATYTKVTTETLEETVNNINVNDYHLKLNEGNYDKLTLTCSNKISGTGTYEDPNIYQRDIDDLVIVGEDEDETIMEGFEFFQGFGVKYKVPQGTGVDYYFYNTYTIENLVFKNITFTNKVVIKSELNDYSEQPTIKINKITFENVTFDFEGVQTDGNGAFYMVSEQAGIKNLTFNDCKFNDCTASSSFNGIAITSNTTDDLNLTVKNCEFENINYNAIQLAGSGSKFNGNIVIENNEINNTGSRAIRISQLGYYANVRITDNIMRQASDGDGELCKATIENGAHITINNNYWGAQIGLIPVKGMVDGSVGGSMIADTAPKN